MVSWVGRHLANRSVRLGLRLGRDIDGLQELEVRGHRSGKRRRTPVKILDVDGRRYIVSLRGSSGWVCNLRASQRATLRFGRRLEWAREGASEAEVLRQAARFPVFRITGPPDDGGDSPYEE